MPLALTQPRPISPLGWVRVSLRILAMALLLLACLPLHYAAALFTRHKPLPRFFLGAVAWLAGVRVRQHGEKVHRGAFLLANHVSWIDIPAMAGATGTAFVGHDGLASMPLLKWLCKLNDTVFVARHDRASVARQVALVREEIRDTGALAIFPEGTTSDGTGLLPFKSSLLSALEPLPEGIAVQPVLLDYGPARQLPADPRAAATGAAGPAFPASAERRSSGEPQDHRRGRACGDAGAAGRLALQFAARLPYRASPCAPPRPPGPTGSRASAVR